MTTRWTAAGLVFLASIASGDLLACGDKFLVPTRGMRFELTPAARQQVAILLYLNPASSLPGLFARLSIEPTLRKAGYRPTVVTSAEQLDHTLRQENWDVVLLDFADSPVRHLSDAASSPAVLAVTANATGREIALAKKQYTAILKSPTRSQTFVDALDVAVMTQHAARAKTEKKSH